MLNIILLILYAVLALAWSLLLLTGSKRYAQMIAALPEEGYLLRNFYPIGLRILDLIHYSYDSSFDRTRMIDARVIWGEKYAKFYYCINMAEKITYAATFLMLTPLLGVLMNDPIGCLFGIAAAGVAFYYADTKITEIIKKRNAEIIRDFADMVFKMALMINAGMTIQGAWVRISESGSGTLYQEMRRTVVELHTGVYEEEAYLNFSRRCNVPLISRFISMLIQSLTKTDRELSAFLREETRVSWEEKKNLVKQEGQMASSKLLIPILMIMVGIFVMVLVPMVSSVNL